MRGDFMYCAIIGDMIGSKKLKDRSTVQNKLADVLDAINQDYYKDIQSKFLITIGDEFQGLLYASGDFLSIIKRIKIEMYPTKLRFGVGVGDISTEIRNIFAIGADGDAYYSAREAINFLKKQEGEKEALFSDISIKISSGKLSFGLQTHQGVDVDIINTTLSACSFIEKKWGAKQMEVIRLKEKGLTQMEIAKKVDIKQSSVHRRLDAAGYYTYIKCLEQVKEYIAKKGW